MLPPDEMKRKQKQLNGARQQVDDKHIKAIHLHPTISGSNSNASGIMAGGKNSHRSKTHLQNNLSHDKYDTSGQLSHSHARAGAPSMTASDRIIGELLCIELLRYN